MISLRWEQALAWRLQQHSLTARAHPSQALQVVSQIGGLHAQVLSAAELALWARVQDGSPTAVQDALWRDRTLVKTWAMRGTLHLLTAAEWPLYAAALNHSVADFYRKPLWLRYYGLTLAELDAFIEGVRATLSDTGLTRGQLAAAIAQRLAKPELEALLLSGWGALLKPVAHRGYLCFGPNQGQHVTFVRADRWLGEWRDGIDPAEALRAVVRRYLTAYGPATVDGFASWWGIPRTKAKRLFQSLGDELVAVDVEGWPAWALAATVPAMTAMAAPDAVRLLPYFDPYVVAVARQSSYLLADERNKGRVYRPQGWIAPVVLVDGRIAGVWELDKRRTQASVTVELFAPADERVREGIAAEAARLSRSLATDVVVAYVS